MPNASQHILVIRLSAMGDVAMSVPVLRAFTQQYPKVKITVLTRSFFVPFFKGLPNTSVFCADLKGSHKGVLGLYKLAKALNKSDFYAVADLHNVLRSNILKRFLNSKKIATIDKGRTEKKALTQGKAFLQLKTTHDRYAEVFERLGFPVDLSSPKFPEKLELNKNLKSLLTGNRKTIGIAPFAAYQGKMYPLKLMEDVIKELSKDTTVILFGGGAREKSVLNVVENKFSNVVNVTGKFSLDEELSLISNLELMLSMDSSNGHIAAMLGVKVVTIWGVTHPFAGFRPFGQSIDQSILPNRNRFPKIPTSIYGNKYPEDYKGVAGSIPAEVVIRKLKSLI